MEKSYIGKWMKHIPVTVLDPRIYLGIARFCLSGLKYGSDAFVKQYNIRQL